MNPNQTFINLYCIFTPLVLTYLIMIFIYWKHYKDPNSAFIFITENLSISPILCLLIEIFIHLWILIGLLCNTFSEYADHFVSLRFSFSFWVIYITLEKFRTSWFGRYLILSSIITLIWNILTLYGLDDNTWKLFLNFLKLF